MEAVDSEATLLHEDNGNIDVRQQYYGSDAPNLRHQYAAATDLAGNTKYTENAIQNLIHSNNYELRRTQSTKSPMWSCYRRIYNKQLDLYTGWIVCLVCRQRKPMHPKSPVREFEEHAAVCMQTESGAAIRAILTQPGSFDVRVSSTRNGVTQEVLTQKTLRLIAKVATRVSGVPEHSKQSLPNLGNNTAASRQLTRLPLPSTAGNNNNYNDDNTVHHQQALPLAVGKSSNLTASSNSATTPTSTPPGSVMMMQSGNRANNKRPLEAQSSLIRSNDDFTDFETQNKRRIAAQQQHATPPQHRESLERSNGNGVSRLQTAGGSNGIEDGGVVGDTVVEPPSSPAPSSSSPRLTFSSPVHGVVGVNIDATKNADLNIPGAASVKSLIMVRYNLGKGWSDVVSNECCVVLPAKPQRVPKSLNGDAATEQAMLLESSHLTALREVVEEEGASLDADGLRYRLPLDGVSALNKLINAGFRVQSFVPLLGDEVCYLLESTS